MRYFYLKEGDIIKLGDECNFNGLRDNNGNLKYGTLEKMEWIIGQSFQRGQYPMRRIIKRTKQLESKIFNWI
jgi:hypothetical protein